MLIDRLKREFVISIQIDPPGLDGAKKFNNVIQELIACGVKLVDINSSRRISHDSLQLARTLSQQNLEVIPHLTTRDSSINGLINQILAATEWGNIQNYLVVTGDPYDASQAIIPSYGVYQTDSIGALREINCYLRKNTKNNLDLSLAAAVNQNGIDMEREGERITEKINAGVDFFMSQPVFSEFQAGKLFDFYKKYSSKPLITGIWPLINRNTVEAIYSGRIEGVVLPEEIKNDIVSHSADEKKLQEYGLKKAYLLIDFIKKLQNAGGVYIVAPSRDPLALIPLLKRFF